MLKPFIKPMSPETAFKFHYGALFVYVLFSTNAAAFAYYYSKKVDPAYIEIEEEEDEMEKRKYGDHKAREWPTLRYSSRCQHRLYTKSF